MFTRSTRSYFGNRVENRIMELPIIRVGERTATNHIFTARSIDRMVDLFYDDLKLNKGNRLCGGPANLNHVTGQLALIGLTHSVEMLYVDSGFLVGVFKFRDDRIAKQCHSMLNSGHCRFYPTLSGKNVDGEIDVTSLHSIDIIPTNDYDIEWQCIK
jgi:hypothetical protein